MRDERNTPDVVQRPDIVQRTAERLSRAAMARRKEPVLGQPQRLAGEPLPAALQALPPALDDQSGETAPAPRGDAAAAMKSRMAATVRLDLRKLEAMGYAVPDARETTRISEEFRLIKRPLLRKALATGRDMLRNGNLIMVTSARPGEGKTFSAVNLALSMASERDLYVMLINADAHSTNFGDIFGIEPGKGLVDLLLDKDLPLSDVLLHTDLPNFTMLPSGSRHPHATELLSSQRMVALTQDIASRYPDRMIIIDTPPVLASTETSVLASHVGQVVFVVEQNRTGWRQIEKSLALLRSCPEISFVLNKVDTLLWKEDYSSYYQYSTDNRVT